MSFGIIELIALLLGLAGFGLTANPKAPTPDQVLQYAIPDTDLTAYIDAVSVVPGNYKLLGQLADQPQIRAAPELQAMVRKAAAEIEGGRSLAKLTTGIDIATDIADATAFVQLVPGGEPRFVVAVHGKLTADNLDKIAKLTGKQTSKIGAASIVDSGPQEPAIGLTKDGVLLFGTLELVRERLATSWQPPSHAAGTNLGYTAEAIAAKPVFSAVLTMSTTARSEALHHLGPPSFASDLVTRHKAAAFSLFRDGVGWTWIDNTKAGLDAMEQVADGMVDVLRAAQIAPRGLAKIAMGALESYRGTSAQLDDLIRHKLELQKIVDAYSGDGNFKAKLDKDVKSLRLTVRATGKSISEVLPVGVIVPLGVAGFLMDQAKRQAASAELAAPVKPPATAKPPAANSPTTKPPVKK